MSLCNRFAFPCFETTSHVDQLWSRCVQLDITSRDVHFCSKSFDYLKQNEFVWCENPPSFRCADMERRETVATDVLSMWWNFQDIILVLWTCYRSSKDWQWRGVIEDPLCRKFWNVFTSSGFDDHTMNDTLFFLVYQEFLKFMYFALRIEQHSYRHDLGTLKFAVLSTLLWEKRLWWLSQ